MSSTDKADERCPSKRCSSTQESHTHDSNADLNTDSDGRSTDTGSTNTSPSHAGLTNSNTSNVNGEPRQLLSSWELLPLPEHPPRAVYVHVPFCRTRCPYCDFTVIVGRDELVPAYLQALSLELKKADVAACPVDSVFFGGGTPSSLAPKELEQLFQLVFDCFQLSEHCEVTLEANPSDLDEQKLRLLAELGVNRLSVGVQAFDDAVLHTLGRDHSARQAVAAVQSALNHFNNVAVDLIFAVPGQSLKQWTDTLEQTIRLAPQHVSTYSLTYEKGTRFWTERYKGRLQPLSEELERQMYAEAMNRLPAAGYPQYELSNFAQRGFQARHNLVYWHGRSYYGFGPGAAWYVRGKRAVNHRSVLRWLNKTLAGESGVYETEILTPEQRARELAMLELRLTEGINLKKFEQRTGFNLLELCGEEVLRHTQAGLLELTDTHVRLTREGRFLADTVSADFL